MENRGKAFEKDFVSSFNEEIFVYRLKDSSSSWGNDKSNEKSRFTSKNICDFIVYAGTNSPNTLFLLELKSCNKKSFSFSQIRINQLEGLYAQSKKKGVKAYFIFNFRAFNNVTFAVTADKIYDFYEKAERKSFSLEWCKDNGILIESKLKRTRYKYAVSVLLN